MAAVAAVAHDAQMSIRDSGVSIFVRARAGELFFSELMLKTEMTIADACPRFIGPEKHLTLVRARLFDVYRHGAK